MCKVTLLSTGRVFEYVFVAKSKEIKTRCNLAESCKEGYGSKTAVLQNDDEFDLLVIHNGKLLRAIFPV
jgi:hypothetical protein